MAAARVASSNSSTISELTAMGADLCPCAGVREIGMLGSDAMCPHVGMHEQRASHMRTVQQLSGPGVITVTYYVSVTYMITDVL